jgi:hypothetical protein
MSSKFKSVKAKLISKLPTNVEDKDRLKRACSTAVSGLETTLTIVKQVAGNVGPPGFQAGISALLFVLDVVKVNPYHAALRVLMIEQKSYQNAEDIELLAQRIDTLMTVLQSSKDRGTLSTAIIGRIDQLSM